VVKRILVGVVVIVALLFVAAFAWEWNSDRALYQQFQEETAAWHARCDAYVDKPVMTPEAKACAESLEAMLAIKKQHGW